MIGADKGTVTLHEALTAFSKSKKGTAYQRTLAGALLKAGRKILPSSSVRLDAVLQSDGRFNLADASVTLRTDASTEQFANALLHESVHVLVEHKIQAYFDGGVLTDAERGAIRRIEAARITALAELSKRGEVPADFLALSALPEDNAAQRLDKRASISSALRYLHSAMFIEGLTPQQAADAARAYEAARTSYGLLSASEAAAESLTNRKLQLLLDTVQIADGPSDEDGGAAKTVWQRVKQALRTLVFGKPIDANSALARSMDAVLDLVNAVAESEDTRDADLERYLTNLYDAVNGPPASRVESNRNVDQKNELEKIRPSKAARNRLSAVLNNRRHQYAPGGEASPALRRGALRFNRSVAGFRVSPASGVIEHNGPVFRKLVLLTSADGDAAKAQAAVDAAVSEEAIHTIGLDNVHLLERAFDDLLGAGGAALGDVITGYQWYSDATGQEGLDATSEDAEVRFFTAYNEALRQVVQYYADGAITEQKASALDKQTDGGLSEFAATLPEVRQRILSGAWGAGAAEHLRYVEAELARIDAATIFESSNPLFDFDMRAQVSYFKRRAELEKTDLSNTAIIAAYAERWRAIHPWESYAAVLEPDPNAEIKAELDARWESVLSEMEGDGILVVQCP